MCICKFAKIVDFDFSAAVLQKERRTLDTKRLDLDAAKSRLKRAKTQQTRDTVSHD